MTKLDTYICDRCGRQFTVQSGINPDQCTLVEQGGPLREWDLCGDCSTVLIYCYRYHKEFDKLANKIGKRHFT